jgi:hypothetical protein
MKHTLHAFFFFLVLFVAQGFTPPAEPPTTDTNPVVFPNPVYDQMSLKNDTQVASIVILNLTGRKVLTFKTAPGRKYDVADLSSGLYLVQFLNANSKVIVTQRMHKR